MILGLARHGTVSRGLVWQGWVGQGLAWLGLAGRGLARLGIIGPPANPEGCAGGTHIPGLPDAAKQLSILSLARHGNAWSGGSRSGSARSGAVGRGTNVAWLA